MKIAYLPALFTVMLLAACSPRSSPPTGEGWMFQPIVKLDEYNPIMVSDRSTVFYCPMRKENVRWEEKDVFNPAAVVRDERVWLLYRAEDNLELLAGTSRIGLANSRDGLAFRKNAIPVLYPDKDKMRDYEWQGGCEDPRIVKRDDGLYIMTYTAYDGKIARLAVATSRDLIEWNKEGLAFNSKRYIDGWSKSGALVCSLQNGQIIATKIDGKYWMYWGDTDLFMATSDDCIRWEPVEDKKGNLVSVLKPRPGFFDSRLVEPGPFALTTNDGILMIYNSANSASNGDKTLASDAYSVGQALFDKKNPKRLLARADKNFMVPEKSYEIGGQVGNVCFVEGMVYFGGRWLLYYGTADSRIAVAEVRR